jgi:hypothetical protein
VASAVLPVSRQLNGAISSEGKPLYEGSDRLFLRDFWDWREKARKDDQIFFARKYYTPLIFNDLEYGHQSAYFRPIVAATNVVR